jgi:nitrile hydratase accessory protein
VKLEGEAAPPRRNGELVFEAPWQGRAFGIGVALCERGLYEWREFQAKLIETIGESGRQQEPAAYYEDWLRALERLLLDRGLVDAGEIERRAAAFRSGERDEVF